MAPLDQILAPPAQQAVIAGLFLAAGWWVVAWQNRRRDAKLRGERVRDLQRALFAEIRAHLATLERNDLADQGALVAARIEAEAGYLPVVLPEGHDMIFRALLTDIHLLPRDTIDPIVLYYSQLNAVSQMAAALRGLDPARAQPRQAAAMFRDYTAMKLGALDLGEAALAAIRANIDGMGTVSRPAADPSERGSA